MDCERGVRSSLWAGDWAVVDLPEIASNKLGLDSQGTAPSQLPRHLQRSQPVPTDLRQHASPTSTMPSIRESTRTQRRRLEG